MTVCDVVVVVVVVASESRGRRSSKSSGRAEALELGATEEPLPRGTTMATHAGIVEQRQGEHDVPYSAYAMKHWEYWLCVTSNSLHGRTPLMANMPRRKHKGAQTLATRTTGLTTCYTAWTVTSIASSPTTRCLQRVGLMKKSDTRPEGVRYWPDVVGSKSYAHREDGYSAPPKVPQRCQCRPRDYPTALRSRGYWFSHTQRRLVKFKTSANVEIPKYSASSALSWRFGTCIASLLQPPVASNRVD